MKREDIPAASLLAKYASDPACYTDCFSLFHSGDIELSTFIGAFYTTRLFRAERFVLQMALGRRISDSEVQALAEGDVSEFAVWDVEARKPDEILLRDRSGRTRSWLKVDPMAKGTQLWFGSAMTPGPKGKIGALVHLSASAHRLYSKRLLKAAARRV